MSITVSYFDQSKIEDARFILSDLVPPNAVSEATGVPLDIVNELAEEFKYQHPLYLVE